jgi:hypothetical protein
MILKRLLIVLTAWLSIVSCIRSQSSVSVPGKDYILNPHDREIFEKIVNQFGNERKPETGDLLIKIARFFLETPYVANTLEAGDSEKMVINLRELDCTTFAENCLALARTLQHKNPGFDDFAKQLQFIRYRDGIREEYPSRLHYFSDWIFNNDEKKCVKSVSKEIAHTLVPNQVNFMTTHPDSYPALLKNQAFISEIARQESEISQRMTWFIPENKLSEVENKIRDGDIIGIKTNIQGLDISHVVIALRIHGRVHFIHASSKEMKVVISDETLEDYLLHSKLASGIMVARPL